MVFDVVARFAREKIQPLVREMDDASQMDKAVINALFEQGVSWILNICLDNFKDLARVNWSQTIYIAYRLRVGVNVDYLLNRARVTVVNSLEIVSAHVRNKYCYY